jgi:hypothetical protein
MTLLRVRVEMNKGGVGVSLRKLAKISLEYEKFLRSFSHDLHLDLNNGDWVAKDFENSSVEYVAEYVGPVHIEVVNKSLAALKYIMNEHNDFADLGSSISRATIVQYAHIAKDIDPDESVEFGVYDNGDDHSIHRFRLSKERSLAIETRFQRDNTIQYEGSFQGKIHSLYKEVEKPHIYVRELSTGNLVVCYYSRSRYEEIAKALKQQDSIVYIGGLVTASRESRKPLYMNLERMRVAEEYREGDLEKFFGCAPNMSDEDLIEPNDDDDVELTH